MDLGFPFHAQPGRGDQRRLLKCPQFSRGAGLEADLCSTPSSSGTACLSVGGHPAMNHNGSIVLSLWMLIPIFYGCGSQPQIGENKEVMLKVVDALYTAVSLKDTKLVDQYAARLKGHLATRSLPG